MSGLYTCILLFSMSITLAKENDLELPLCPLNIEYFPQELPMHCRMPRNAASQTFRLPDIADDDKVDKHQAKRKATLPPEFAYYQSPSPDKIAPPISFPVPPFPMPGMPPGPPGMDFPMSGPMLGMPGPNPSMSGPNPGMPGPIPGMPVPIPGMPGGFPLPMPMPVPGGPPHKMPVIVMPFYSQDRRQYTRPPRRQKHKRKPHRHDSSDTDLTSDEFDDDSQFNESSEEGWWKRPKKNKNKKKKGYKKYGISRRFNRHHNINKQKKKELLTPILQYVTKDGYVIFEKKISNHDAKDWLGPKDGAMANKEVKEASKVYDEKNNYKNLELDEEHDPKLEIVELSKDNIESKEAEEAPRIKIHKKDDSRESNEINETLMTRKFQRKKKFNPLLRPGPQP